MASVGSLVFQLAGDVAHLRQDMKKAQDIISQSLNSIKKMAGALGIAVGASFAVGMARSLGESVKATYDQASALGNLAERIGTTTAELQRLQHAASISNVSTESLTTGFRFLGRALIDARDPASKAAQAINAIGLSVDSLRAMDPAEAMRTIASAMAEYQDGMEKGRVATDLFGRGGQELIPLLNRGGEAIRLMGIEADNFGITLSQPVQSAMAEFNNQLTRVNALSQGMKTQLAIAVLPALEEMVKWFLEGAQKGSGLSQVFAFIAEQAILTAADIQSLTGRLQLQIEVFANWIRVAKSIAQLNFREAGAAWDDIIQKPIQGLATLDQNIEEMKNRSRQRYRDLIAGLGDVGTAAAGAGGKVIQLADPLEKSGRAARAAKAGVDEYARILQSLQEELRRTIANGDEMQVLLTDPKVLTFSQAQQENLARIKQETLDVAEANRIAKQTQDEWDAVRKAAEDANVAEVERLRGVASAMLDTLDPSREYGRALEDINAARMAGFLTATQLTQAEAYLAEQYRKSTEALDPLKKKLEEIKQAALGWGKQATDSFIDFISGADNAQKSFGEMTASILRDIAKMLVHKNFLEPLFSGLSGGGWGGFGGGGLGGIFGGLFSSAPLGVSYGGQRAAGGAVYPGQLYRVNESPFSAEFFRPSTPGTVQRSNENQPINIAITVNTQTGETTAEGDTQQAIELAKRMANVARQVISTEKRAGGLLAS
ncbi:hypothetical protein AB3X91_16235 [Paraburkholderia sp. BR14263]|uniref:hypothetical protein n=1 Tax=unclassified Paraburkholderia TaxID=2615204 RepID=UPI0034CD2617